MSLLRAISELFYITQNNDISPPGVVLSFANPVDRDRFMFAVSEELRPLLDFSDAGPRSAMSSMKLHGVDVRIEVANQPPWPPQRRSRNLLKGPRGLIPVEG